MKNHRIKCEEEEEKTKENRKPILLQAKKIMWSTVLIPSNLSRTISLSRTKAGYLNKSESFVGLALSPRDLGSVLPLTMGRIIVRASHKKTHYKNNDAL